MGEVEPRVKITLELTAEKLLTFLKMLKKHDKELFELFSEKLKEKLTINDTR